MATSASGLIDGWVLFRKMAISACALIDGDFCQMVD